MARPTLVPLILAFIANSLQPGQADNKLVNYVCQGELAIKQHRKADAIKYIDLLKRSAPESIEAAALETRWLASQGKFKEALALLTDKLKQGPRAVLLVKRAQIYEYIEDDQKSLKDYMAAANCADLDGSVCTEIVKGLNDNERWDDALAIGQKGMKLKSVSGPLCAQTAEVARKLNKLNLAEEYLERAIALGPPRVASYQELVSLHKVMKKWSAVVDDCNRLAKTKFNLKGHLTYARCLEICGEAHNHLKMYEEAVSDLTKASEISPLKSTIFKERAIAYDNLGQKDLAQKDRETAKQIDNSF